MSRSKCNPPKSYVGFFLIRSPFYPGCGVGSGWIGRCRLTIVACVVRSSMDSHIIALTAKSPSVFFFFFFGEWFTHQTHSSISMSSLKHVERTKGAAHDVASAVCVCVVLHLEIMLFSFQRFCVFCFPGVPRCCHRNNTICIVDVSVLGQNKQFVPHATTHALSLHRFSRLCFFGSLYQ